MTEGRYLITTDNWFIAPDGEHYKAAWGRVNILEDTFLGVKTNRQSTNWFAKIGGDDMEVIIAGCQIHYAVRCDECPEMKPPTVEIEHQGEMFKDKASNSRIYLAELI